MSSFYTSAFQWGNNILVRGFDENGERIHRKVRYEPRLWVRSTTETGFTDIYGDPLKLKEFDSINEAKDFLKKYKDIEGVDVYGFPKFNYVYLNDYFKKIDPDTKLINVVNLDIEVDSSDGMPNIKEASKEITAVSLRRRNKKIVFGCGDFSLTKLQHLKPKDMENLLYVKCRDEEDLIMRFMNVWEGLDIDVITGWNIEKFDIPYLHNRIRNLMGEKFVKRLSPWGIIKKRTIKDMFGEEEIYELLGISNLDYLNLYKKFILSPRESYKLDYIAEVELKEKKIDYSQYGNLHTLHRENYQLFIEYNIKDTDLIFRLEEALGLLELAFAIAYEAGINFQDSLATVLPWEVIIHNHLIEQNIVMSPKTYEHGAAFEGAYVKDPMVGMHKWVMSFDLNSLYPSLIRQYNIGPDTKLPTDYGGGVQDEDLFWKMTNVGVDTLLTKEIDTDFLKENNLTMTPNRQLYKKDKKSFLSVLMKKFYDERRAYKKKMLECKKEYERTKDPAMKTQATRYDNIQKARKVLLNGAYGACGNEHFIYFDLHNAAAITTSGKLSILWVEKKINDYMNNLLKTDAVDYVIAIDTDSIYVTFDALVNKVYHDTSDTVKVINFLDKIASEKIEPVLEEAYAVLAEYLNVYENTMVMAREIIADRAIWTAKKRYIANVWDNEGVRYSEPKLKIMGIEAIRSSTPKVCQDFIKETLKKIMKGSETAVQEYIVKVREIFDTLGFESIAFPRSVNMVGMRKDPATGIKKPYDYSDPVTIYKKGTPAHVKGALIYNYYIDKLGLEKQFEKIKNGEKIKFCYLKVPNRIRDKVIAAPGALPDEFKIKQELDYDLQFEKAFLSPIETILHSIGWEAEKKSTLEDFFA